MQKINRIHLTNFRGFRSSGPIDLAPLTFLVGPNSSGKSSLVDGILLISQSVGESILWTTPEWMGRLVDLGSYKDTVYKHAMPRQMEIGLTIELDQIQTNLRTDRQNQIRKSTEASFNWDIKSDSKSDIGRLSCLSVIDSISKVQIDLINTSNGLSLQLAGEKVLYSRERNDFRFLNYEVQRIINNYIKDKKAPLGTKSAYLRLANSFEPMTYFRFLKFIERVSSARSGPKRWVPKGVMQNTNSGFQGLLDDPYTMSLEPNAVGRFRIRRRGAPMETVAEHLSSLGIASEIKRQDLSAYHGAINVTDSVSKIISNLADVGYGASQVIPVIRGCISDSDSPLILEQPEIHLHPKAQSELANLICKTSLRRQVIVETHSEHMINKARILIANGDLRPEDVTIIYVDRKPTGSNATTIGIDKNGDFTKEWPSGFFDERYKDTLKLVELKSKNASIIKISKSFSQKISQSDF